MDVLFDQRAEYKLRAACRYDGRAIDEQAGAIERAIGEAPFVGRSRRALVGRRRRVAVGGGVVSGVGVAVTGAQRVLPFYWKATRVSVTDVQMA